MQNSSENTAMERVYKIVRELKTPTEQNLAAALLETLKHKTEIDKKPRRKRKPA